MGGRAAVVGVVGRARARAAVHDLSPSTARARRRAPATSCARCGSAAGAGARYDLGCLYAGVNDVRGLDWDREASPPITRPSLDAPGRALRPCWP